MVISKKMDLNEVDSKRLLRLFRSIGIDLSEEKIISIYIEDGTLVIGKPDKWDQKVIADSNSFDFWDNPEDSIYDDL